MTSEQPLPQPTPDPAGVSVTADDRQWGMIAHLSALIGLVVGFMFLGPLIVWAMKKDQSEYIAYHGREALNFQITMLIVTIACAASLLCFVGIVLLPAALVVNIIFTVIAGMKANEGQRYRYPFCLRLIG